jgi:hypothetical protein
LYLPSVLLLSSSDPAPTEDGGTDGLLLRLPRLDVGASPDGGVESRGPEEYIGKKPPLEGIGKVGNDGLNPPTGGH